METSLTVNSADSDNSRKPEAVLVVKEHLGIYGLLITFPQNFLTFPDNGSAFVGILMAHTTQKTIPKREGSSSCLSTRSLFSE